MGQLSSSTVAPDDRMMFVFFSIIARALSVLPAISIGLPQQMPPSSSMTVYSSPALSITEVSAFFIDGVRAVMHPAK